MAIVQRKSSSATAPVAPLAQSRTCLHVTTGLSVARLAYPPASRTALHAADQLPHTAVTTLADGQLSSSKRRSACPPRRRACVLDQS